MKEEHPIHNMVCQKFHKEDPDPDPVFLGHQDPDPDPNFKNRISGPISGRNQTGPTTLLKRQYFNHIVKDPV